MGSPGISWLVLCVCLVVSAAVSLRWASAASDAEQDAFEAKAEAVRAVVSSELRADGTLVASLQGLVAGNDSVTNTDFLRWYEASRTAERFPDGVDLGFVERVPAASLAEFGAEVSADPVAGLSVSDVYTVFPDRPASEYCLQRVGIWTRSEIRGFEIPAGLDLCAGDLPGIGVSEVPALLEEATDTGVPQTAAPEQFVDGSFVIIAPVYAGAIPDTLRERRASSAGWVTGSFDASQLAEAALAGTTDLSVTVLHSTDVGLPFAIARGGNDATSMTLTLPLDDNPGWSVVVGLDPSSAVASPFVQGVVVLLAGVALSLFAYMLVSGLTRARTRADGVATDRTAEMDYRSLHDDLTGLPTRTLILDRIVQMQARTQRPQGIVAALSVEIDGFAATRDTLGHVAADQLINAVATRVTSALRDSDTVGRLSENGFVVLVQGELPLATPELAAQRILDILSEPFALGDTSLPIGTSIGIASGSNADPEELLRSADMAMYRAKEENRSTFVVFESGMGRDMDRRIEIERDLRRALERDQLFLQYQPMFSLRTGRITGVEALVRWQHPTAGLIPPDDFIPFAEKSLRIVPIGRWVLREACRRAAQWTSEGHPITVAVNMSTVQIEDDSFVNDVKEALSAASLRPDQLVLELTETALLSDITVVRFRLEALKDLGVGIAIDDFGTGYTSLTYLQQFPVDTIKLDKSYVDEIAVSPEAAALSRTLMQLGRSLGLETLAEGIETRPQLDELISEGCHSGQGYLYSRPLDADAVSEFLEKPPLTLHPTWATSRTPTT